MRYIFALNQHIVPYRPQFDFDPNDAKFPFSFIRHHENQLRIVKILWRQTRSNTLNLRWIFQGQVSLRLWSILPVFPIPFVSQVFQTRSLWATSHLNLDLHMVPHGTGKLGRWSATHRRSFDFRGVPRVLPFEGSKNSISSICFNKVQQF